MRGSVVWVVVAVAGLGLAGCRGDVSPTRYQPAPDISPGEVVRRQVQALGHNSAWGNDRGIRRAYRFASPANREAVGALPRFAELVRNPGYRALLNHRDAEYSETVIDNGRAAVEVTVTTIAGQRADFVFFLSLNDRDDCQGCWLTDAVQPGPDHPPAGAPRVTI